MNTGTQNTTVAPSNTCDHAGRALPKMRQLKTITYSDHPDSSPLSEKWEWDFIYTDGYTESIPGSDLNFYLTKMSDLRTPRGQVRNINVALYELAEIFSHALPNIAIFYKLIDLGSKTEINNLKEELLSWVFHHQS